MPSRRRRKESQVAPRPPTSTPVEPDLSPYLRRVPEFTSGELYWVDARRKKIPTDIRRRLDKKLRRMKAAIRRERSRWEASGHGPIYVEPPATP